MNYQSSDFDNLNAGINILNIEETITELIPYEGTYSDKGKGYKQQYALLYAYNITEVSRLQIDFCFIFKDGFTPQNVTNLNFNGHPLTITPTITSDSDGNVVWLYENADTWYDLPEFYEFDLSYIRWYVDNIEYSYYIRSNIEIDGKQPDEFDVVFYEVTETNLSFEANRYSPTSSELEIKFDGTFYNGSLGLVNNSIQDIIIYHFDDNDNRVNDKTLVNGTDYTIDGNRVYSGTSTQARPILVNTGILYNQKNEIIIEVKTIAVNNGRSYMIPKGIPVCNWQEGKFCINGDLYIADEDGENKKEIRDLIYPIGSIYLSVNNVNPSNLFGGTWVAFGTGRTLVGVDTSQTEFNTVEKTGGEKTHTLTIDEMPSHNHDSNGWAAVTDGSGNYNVFGAMSGGSTKEPTKNTGGSQPHNNLPPYITCYMWKRTA